MALRSARRRSMAIRSLRARISTSLQPSDEDPLEDVLDGGIRIGQNLVHQPLPEPDLNQVVRVPERHQTFSLAHVENKKVHSCRDHPMEDPSQDPFKPLGPPPPLELLCQKGFCSRRQQMLLAHAPPSC